MVEGKVAAKYFSYADCLKGHRAAAERNDTAAAERGAIAVARGCAAAERAAADDGARSTTASSTPDDVVKLNVGGARFMTSRAVLTKVEDSMLGRMFGRCDAMLRPDPVDGSIFIDRDGEHFGMLLDFLRGDPPDGPRMQRAMRALPWAAQEALGQELDYFGLGTAVFGVRPWTEGARFRLGPEMSKRRAWLTAVSAGGRAIVFDGSNFETTEVLETQTMAFMAGPSLLRERLGCAAVQIDADRVLVVGGMTAADETLKTTEMLNLATLTFAPGPNMKSARAFCAAVALDARRILVVGGHSGASELTSTEILSLDTMAFAPGPDMATQRVGCAAVALDEHHIMAVGGSHSNPEGWNSIQVRLNTTEVLDIRTMSFASGPSMGSARSDCAAVSVDAQRVLVIGGWGERSKSLASTELLDVAMMEFTPGPIMQTRRQGCAAARLDSAEARRIVVFGGDAGPRSALSVTEVLAVKG